MVGCGGGVWGGGCGNGSVVTVSDLQLLATLTPIPSALAVPQSYFLS